MVAEFTQKDPKEYLPFIEGLKQTENEIEFKVKICIFLKNYSKAVLFLSQGTEDQVKRAIELIEEKKIYLEGIDIFKNRVEQK